jgi:hypothetical protein
MESKKFSVDVKCEDPVVVNFDGPVIFVSNEHPYGDERFLGRLHVVCANRPWSDDVEEVWVCRP